MTITETYPSYEAIWQAVLERMPHALRKHPENLTDQERLDAVMAEFIEVQEAFDNGDMPHAFYELIDVIVCTVRAAEQLARVHHIPITGTAREWPKSPQPENTLHISRPLRKEFFKWVWWGE